LDYDTLRLVDLAVYDPKQKSFHLPGKPAGSDNLGNLFHSASIGTAGFDGVQVKMADLKKVGTENNTVKFSFLDKEITFVPLNLTGLTPYDGAPARKFANTYTRLFRDYLGIEDAKLGKEGMTGSEKFFMGLEMATAGMSAYSAFASMGTMMNSTQLLALSNALNASASTLQRSKLQQRQILRDNQFKLIPAEPFQLTYREDLR
jgi:hypothetical protein